MVKGDTIINIINLILTLSNSILAIILESYKNSFISETTSTLLRYRYFLYVLLGPYFKLLMTALVFDILLYSLKFILTRYFLNINQEDNQQNILIKSVQDNMISNILVEFFFMVMIKGLALGFGIFYIVELNEEIDKIKGIGDDIKEQKATLDKMKTIIIIGGISNSLTIAYQFIFFGFRLYLSCYKTNSFCKVNKNNKLAFN